jgi:YbgC/YbaW family acyl-CoA thioester hydrolase
MPRFVIEHRVPWADVDLAKMVYFPRFFSYFEMAELEWIRQEGYDYERFLSDMEVWLPRVATNCNYHAPLRLADVLSIEMRLARLGRTSYTFGFDVYRLPERVHAADGTITIACVSRTRFRPVNVPRKLARLLRKLGNGSGERDAEALSSRTIVEGKRKKK